MSNIRVLVACERSGIVREAFNQIHGFYAISCDLYPPDDGRVDYHYQGDVRDILYEHWDMMIAHPECTRLCNSGVRWLKERDLWNELREAAEFFKLLMDVPIKFKAIENPIPHKYAVEIIGRNDDQLIQPYMFGHMETKGTCLWLENLPKLKPTNDVREQMKKLSKKERQRTHYMSPSPERAYWRARTFPGIAQAMADQWSKYVLSESFQNSLYSTGERLA